MAQASATLKVTPNELQIIAAALKMYAHANRMLSKDYEIKHPLEGYQHDMTIGGGDPRRLAMAAEKVRQDIGLK